jgi:hypothetical protein
MTDPDRDDAPVLILGSWEHERFATPAGLCVREIVDGLGDRRSRQYARATLTPYESASGDEEHVIIRRRSGKRWKLPRPGRTLEVLVWDTPAGGSGPFDEPWSGASICYLVVDTMANQVELWRKRSRW